MIECRLPYIVGPLQKCRAVPVSDAACSRRRETNVAVDAVRNKRVLGGFQIRTSQVVSPQPRRVIADAAARYGNSTAMCALKLVFHCPIVGLAGAFPQK